MPELERTVVSQTTHWQRFQTMVTKQRLPHALLLIGSQHTDVLDFSYRMAMAILCRQNVGACGQCKSCHLMSMHQHPDFNDLQPEKQGGTLKIDQIRDLQTVVYNSPQLGHQRVVRISPAEKMTVSGSNALLKLLEEPPAQVIFILVAEYLSNLLPTVLSRCQQWFFSRPEQLTGYLTVGEFYNRDSSRGIIFSHHYDFIEDLLALVKDKALICNTANKWANYGLGDVLWLIYLINAEMLNCHLCKNSIEKSELTQLYKLALKFNPLLLLKQIAQINKVQKKLQQSINLNTNLVLENLLLGYFGG